MIYPGPATDSNQDYPTMKEREGGGVFKFALLVTPPLFRLEITMTERQHVGDLEDPYQKRRGEHHGRSAQVTDIFSFQATPLTNDG
jgi:hypothetical protein